VDPNSLTGALFTSLVLGSLFLALLYLAGRMMGIEEVPDLLNRPLRKVRAHL
jgi:hypothetical protein